MLFVTLNVLITTFHHKQCGPNFRLELFSIRWTNGDVFCMKMTRLSDNSLVKSMTKKAVQIKHLPSRQVPVKVV